MKTTVDSVEPDVAFRMVSDGAATLVDVRTPEEAAKKRVPGALAFPRDTLELDIERAELGMDAPLLIVCQSGTRAMYAARGLRAGGYSSVAVVAGGMSAWETAGLPTISSRLSEIDLVVYGRQIALPDFGVAGQERLKTATVAVIGAGGIGCPLMLYLAAMGVGELVVIDDDSVDASNLNRQILYRLKDIGRAKVDVASEAIAGLAPELSVVRCHWRLDDGTVADLPQNVDVLVDATDNLATRYLLSELSAQMNVPLVVGAVYRDEAQVGVFAPSNTNSGCFNCMFPNSVPGGLAPTCSEAGVLGVVPGLVATLQAYHVIRLLLGKIPPRNFMLSIDLTCNEFVQLDVPRRRQCYCGASKKRRSRGLAVAGGA